MNNKWAESKPLDITEMRLQCREAAEYGELIKHLQPAASSSRRSSSSRQSSSRSTAGQKPPVPKTTKEYHDMLSLHRIEYKRLGESVDTTPESTLADAREQGLVYELSPNEVSHAFPVLIKCSCKSFRDHRGCVHIPFILHLEGTL